MQLELTPFEIEFVYANKSYNATVVQDIKNTIETFTVTHAGKSIQVTSDRPQIQGRKKPKFKAVNAKVNQQPFYEKVIEAVKAHIYKIEHPPFDWSTHPKNNPY
jgi:hypothetical protein